MGDSITSQNEQLEKQAQAQVQQAEDIKKMMAAIQAISTALQIGSSQRVEDDSMQIDIPPSNQNKRKKQTGMEPTTLLTAETQESIITQPNAAEIPKGVYDAEEQ